MRLILVFSDLGFQRPIFKLVELFPLIPRVRSQQVKLSRNAKETSVSSQLHGSIPLLLDQLTKPGITIERGTVKSSELSYGTKRHRTSLHSQRHQGLINDSLILASLYAVRVLSMIRSHCSINASCRCTSLSPPRRRASCAKSSASFRWASNT